MVGERVLVRVGALAHGGAFVADIIDAAPEAPRKKVFIRDVAPGEVVEARIDVEEKNLFRAVPERIIERSAARVSPPCPYFGVCGGCDLQHLHIAAQREAKRIMVERSLQFQAKVMPRRGVQAIGLDLPEFYYRRRITLHLNTAGELGFYRPQSGDIVDLDRCLLASQTVNRALAEIRPMLPLMSDSVGAIGIEEFEGEILFLLKLRDGAGFPFSHWPQVRSQFSNVVVEKGDRVRYSQRAFREEPTPSYPAGHFSQVNAAGNAILVASVLDLVRAEEVTELYAGSGNFSIPLAKMGARVIAVEADEALVLLGRRQAAAEAVGEQIQFVHATCGHHLKKHALTPSVLLDPPRSGMKELLPYFKAPNVRSVVYVSCSLPTLTRDVRVLCESGYSVEEVRVLDMFSQTHHVETITHLVRGHAS